MGTPFQAGPESEVRQASAIVDAANATRVNHLIYSSGASADQTTGVPHFESKFAVEQRVRASDLLWTIVAPVGFFEILTMPWNLPSLRQGIVSQVLPPDRPQQYVADLGAIVSLVVEQQERFAAQRVEIASEP
jgi:uncharacterized protein YbjT (DUF2867 family)